MHMSCYSKVLFMLIIEIITIIQTTWHIIRHFVLVV